MDKSNIEALSFEDSYSRLEQVIRMLEEGDLTLDESVALYEEGMSLAKRCGRHLDQAELKVSLLLASVAEDSDSEEPI